MLLIQQPRSCLFRKSEEAILRDQEEREQLERNIRNRDAAELRSCRKVLKRGAYQFKNIILYFCFA
ncbi:hypothetical protein Scep_022570 [Stephania cephalantha]|uniref:Uncharacterized protein n=1 Tax=Stephania cephalantha TaxID=152367 RepID=A0AAP0F5P0_9MAGN